MTGTRKKILFIFYILLTGLVLLYLLFPADAVRNDIANRIQQNVPNVQVTIGSLRLAFPPALSFGDVSFSSDGTILFSMDRLKLTPRWRTLLFSTKIFSFKGVAYHGMISGTLSAVMSGDSPVISATGSFSGIQLEQIPAVRKQTSSALSGSLSGNFHLDASSMNQPAFGGHISVSDCNFVPPFSFLDMKRLDFDSIEADLDFDGDNLDIQGGNLVGPEMTGTVNGNIYFETPLSRSELDLDISVTPLQSSKFSGINVLTFKATETFENPKLTLVSTR